ncbi:MAG: hypothetical protein PQJ49_11050 [Sphaerochaetaceae bacterium]|nr:hypothetical protein [Sphaerochaetaceae bacterium]
MDKFFKNKSIALFIGGRSPEHEVSIESAKTVYPILQKLFNKVYVIGVSKNGVFYIQNLLHSTHISHNYQIKDTILEKDEISFYPSKGIFLHEDKIDIDLAFILIHGNEGEDGKLQGLLDIMNIKYCGVNATSSGLCMYKELASSILESKGIKTVKSIVLKKGDTIYPLSYYIEKLGNHLFIKSETTGSSIGVTSLKFATQELLDKAIEKAFKYSERVLIQPLMEDIQEMEVAILELENNKLIAGGPGLVVKSNMMEILSYDKKYGQVDSAYIDPFIIKDEKLKLKLQEMAKLIFKTLNLSGFSRIDFFYKDKQIYFNEVNTIPGLTSKSHYPVLINSLDITLEEAIYEICRRAYGR